MKWKINGEDIEQNPIQSEHLPENNTKFENTVCGFEVTHSSANFFEEKISASWSSASVYLRDILSDIYIHDKEVVIRTHSGLERRVTIDTYTDEETGGKLSKSGSSVYDIDLTFRVVGDS